jgi:two-component system sensor histidine kinase/response regulator
LSNRPTGGESSTGVGLSLSKQLIEQHHGVIGARNNPAGGATFWIRLPVKTPPAEQTDTGSPATD